MCGTAVVETAVAATWARWRSTLPVWDAQGRPGSWNGLFAKHRRRKVRPRRAGRKVHAVFGFSDIRNFTDCCEVLEEETMIFTNIIAAVVHGCVHSSGGVVNKNIGDAFLAVWKVKQSKAKRHGSTGTLFDVLEGGAVMAGKPGASAKAEAPDLRGFARGATETGARSASFWDPGGPAASTTHEPS